MQRTKESFDCRSQWGDNNESLKITKYEEVNNIDSKCFVSSVVALGIKEDMYPRCYRSKCKGNSVEIYIANETITCTEDL